VIVKAFGDNEMAFSDRRKAPCIKTDIFEMSGNVSISNSHPTDKSVSTDTSHPEFESVS